MNPMKIAVLVHPSCMPPVKATQKQAEWADWKTEFYVQKSLKALGHQVVLVGVPDSLEELQERLLEVRPQLVFNLLEEFQGNPNFESHLVAFLELMGISYTGCGPQGLFLGRDKALSKKVVSFQGIPTPRFFTVPLGRRFKIPHGMSFPMIVKSQNEEASLGISQSSVVATQAQLEKRVAFIHTELGTPALVEEYIDGREFYVGVIGNKTLKVLPPWELDFGDLKSQGRSIATRSVKFNQDYCKRHQIVRGPARGLDDFTLRKIENYSRDIYRALNFHGYARLDFRLSPKGQIYFLEANPNAELAKGECLANAAQHIGLTYNQLIAKILRLGLSYEMAA